MQKNRKIDISIIVIFIILLISPTIIYFFVKEKLPKYDSENRNLAIKPIFELNSLKDFPKRYDDYYNDNLPFREIIQRIYNNVDYYIFKVKSFNNVVIGKKSENGKILWLFYDKKSDGNPIQYAMGTRIFSQEEKNNAVINIKQNTDVLKQKNMELYYFIAPNKSTIYKEMLPNTIEIKNDKNEILNLYEYIKSQNVTNIVYPYNELMEAKKTNSVFYSLDTHWNYYGGFLGTSMLHNNIDSNYDYLFKNAKIVNYGLIDLTGDLSRILNISGMHKYKEENVIVENFLEDKKYSITENDGIYTYINENPLIDKQIVIIGDSFNDPISNTLAKMYRKVTYMPIFAYSEGYLDLLNPDIVIFEAVERYIDNLINFTF